ncbi:MAG TPA: hypothetical protein VEP30_09790 [Chthoniobacterales bacterium]|nr:hypothetical protein [Chthoniobacterales bacterium]
MKRERFDYGRMALPASFVRPSADDELNLARTFSLPGQRGRRARKIFVIKKTSRLRSTNGADKKIRRILIFDNHPDTLRLVFARRPDPHVDVPAPQRVSSCELIIVCLLTFVGLIGMFWPIL